MEDDMNEIQMVIFVIFALFYFWLKAVIFISERNHRRWARQTINLLFEHLDKKRFFERNPL
jgi:hypothetical protein